MSQPFMMRHPLPSSRGNSAMVQYHLTYFLPTVRIYEAPGVLTGSSVSQNQTMYLLGTTSATSAPKPAYPQAQKSPGMVESGCCHISSST